MTRLRDLPQFDVSGPGGPRSTTDKERPLYCSPLRISSRRRRPSAPKDWPIIDALVEAQYRALGGDPTPGRVAFWLTQSRTPERLFGLVQRFTNEARAHSSLRLLLSHAITGEGELLRQALDAEARAEQAKDCVYWAPLRAELESFRSAERVGDWAASVNSSATGELYRPKGHSSPSARARSR